MYLLWALEYIPAWFQHATVRENPGYSEALFIASDYLATGGASFWSIFVDNLVIVS
jgi:hypothetical protein